MLNWPTVTGLFEVVGSRTSTDCLLFPTGTPLSGSARWDFCITQPFHWGHQGRSFWWHLTQGVICFGFPVIAADVPLLKAPLMLLILSLVSTTPKVHQRAEKSLATIVCVLTVIDALEHSAIVHTWSPTFQLKLQLQGFW